jgi:hypothetical protein
MSNRCFILFPQYSLVDPEDKDGCFEPCGHFGPHKFRLANGDICEWEYEYCGCASCDNGDECITFRILKSQTNE